MEDTIKSLITGTVKDMSDSNTSKIETAKTDIQETIIKEVKETVIKEVIHEESDVDISNLASKDEVAAVKSEIESTLDDKVAAKVSDELADTVAAVDTKVSQLDSSFSKKADKASLFTKDGEGVFSAGWTATDGSTHRFEAEEGDFGGVFGYNAPKNIKSYVGLHKSGENEDIDGQIYAIDNTSKVGTRINFGKKGAYYLANSTNLGTPDDREIAVKGDIPDVSQFITQANIDSKADKTELEDAVNTINNTIELKADKTEIPDVSNFITVDDIATKADKADVYTKDDVINLLEAKANLEDVYKKVDTYSAEKIQELLDLEANKDEVYTISQVDTKLDAKADKSMVDALGSSKADKSDLFKNGVFNVGWTDADGSTHNITTEANDFGGIFGYNAVKNTKNFVGLNKVTGNDTPIDGQFYAINPDTKIGTRLQLSKENGLFYLKNSKNLGLPEGREVAVKEDIPDVSQFVTANDIATKAEKDALVELETALMMKIGAKANAADVASLESTIDNKLSSKADKEEVTSLNNAVNESLAQKVSADNFNTFKEETESSLEGKADKTDIPDTSTLVDINSFNDALSQKADNSNVYSKDETYTKNEVIGLLEAKANLEDVYKKVDTYSAEKIQELLDLEANKDEVYTISQVDTKLAEKADKEETSESFAKKADKSSLFTKNGEGVFSAGWTDNDGSTHRFEAEEGDFGGIFGYNAPKDIKSYVGLHKSGEGEGIDGQIYAIDNTSKVGMRINFGKNGAFYLNGTTNLGTPAERELAVKEDIPSVEGFATVEDLASKADASELTIVNNTLTAALNTKANIEDIPSIDGLISKDEAATKEELASLSTSMNTGLDAKADKSEIPDVSAFVTESELNKKADKTEIPDISNLATIAQLNTKANSDDVYTKDDVINLLSAKANLEDVYKKVDTYSSEKIQELLDLEANKDEVYTISQVDTKLAEKADKADLFKNGAFNVGWTAEDGSTHNITTEANDFGGIFGYNKPMNIKSFIGLNKSTSGDVIDGQIYAIDNTSKIGTRINITKNGVYYLNGTTNLGTPEGRELAVKEDIPSVEGFAKVEDLVNKADYADVYTRTTVDDLLSDKADASSLSSYALKSSLFANNGTGVFNAGWTDEDGSTHYFNAEAGDFGGIFSYNKPGNVKIFTGHNKNAGGDVDGQFYAVDNTTKIGTRLQVSKDNGLFYLKGTTNIGMPAGREIAVIDDLANFVDASTLSTELDKKVSISSIFKNNVFYYKQEDADKSYNLFFAEKNSGGGNQYFNANTNVLSYLGVNKNPGYDANGKSKDVDVQLYAKDKTTNIGTRVNITAKEGMFYLKNSTNLGLPAGREVAVQDDISALQAQIDSLQTLVAQLQSALANAVDANGNPVYTQN